MGKIEKISPFAPSHPPILPPMEGVRLSTVAAGIKYRDRKDVLLMMFPEGTHAGGVLTRSKTASAPVEWCRTQLVHGSARALIVNSGNANAFTGKAGRETVEITATYAAQAAGCAMDETYVASTGVIGEALDPEKFHRVLESLAAAAREDAWSDAARAIMTTDTYPKLAHATANLGGTQVVLNGIAKGSGMIAPDMATMLAFVVTDAALSQPLLATLCRRHAARTFNCVTVDSDTSTSDTLLVFATGTAMAGKAPVEDPESPEANAFSLALYAVFHDLALQVVKDGEGISKLMRIAVEGAENDHAARVIGLSIGNSPLVKTAIAGGDANWGRIVMAVGKSGEAADRDRLSIRFGDIPVAEKGERHPLYREADGAAYLTRREIEICVDAGTGGPGKAVIWASDLTHDYIAINADYRS